MKEGDRVRCVKSRNGITIGRVYTVLNVRTNHTNERMFLVENDAGRQVEYYAYRFRPVDAGIEFTDEEYESLLV